MACRYILQDDFHEQYLLGKLDEETIKTFDAHLDNCDSCQKKLSADRMLIAGIRGAGRMEMKSEIRRQVRQAGAVSSSDWAMIYKVAAVVMVLMISTVLMFYFQNQQTPEMILTEKAESAGRVKMDSATFAEGINEPAAPPEVAEDLAASEEKETAAPGNDLAKQEEPQTRRRSAAKKQETVGESTLAEISTATRGAASGAGAGGDAEKGDLSEAVTTEDTQFADLAQKEDVPAPEEDAASAAELAVKSAAPLAATSAPQKSLDELQPIERVPVQMYRYEDNREILSAAKQSFSTKSTTTITSTAEKRASNSATAEQIPQVFKAGDNSIEIYLIAGIPQYEVDESDSLPSFFPVEILSYEPEKIEMNWLVSHRPFSGHWGDLILQLMPEKILHVVLPDEFVYEIDLKNTSTKAVLQK